MLQRWLLTEAPTLREKSTPDLKNLKSEKCAFSSFSNDPKLEKIDFSTKIERRYEVRDMGPGGRKACQSGAWERFLASHERPSTSKKI